ncbi:hypothetical protein QVD17_29788 [Tagetes erecta]|uniref:Uncharacterized protein n=1 Tax=Tagetes erecta TaxID=13708 RepID=A0AAD8K0A2_TARER|nr:hypothetical protein QVD17_29788 [Tagetes erecta]
MIRMAIVWLSWVSRNELDFKSKPLSIDAIVREYYVNKKNSVRAKHPSSWYFTSYKEFVDLIDNSGPGSNDSKRLIHSSSSLPAGSLGIEVLLSSRSLSQ